MRFHFYARTRYALAVGMVEISVPPVRSIVQRELTNAAIDWWTELGMYSLGFSVAYYFECERAQCLRHTVVVALCGNAIVKVQPVATQTSTLFGSKECVYVCLCVCALLFAIRRDDVVFVGQPFQTDKYWDYSGVRTRARETHSSAQPPSHNAPNNVRWLRWWWRSWSRTCAHFMRWKQKRRRTSCDPLVTG